MQPLDPLTFPLSGIRLIEASAGTGKTYTIAALYLRLLLEQRRDIEEILVVTFTQAATEELRDRIRRAIRGCLVALESGGTADGLPGALLGRLTDVQQSRQMLRDALTRMDEAAIFTIHGFCQRMLQHNAFESGVLFEAELITDEGELRRTIAEDFWRRRFYGVSLEQARWVRGQWASPEVLLGEIDGFLKHPAITVLPPVTQAQVEDAARAAADLVGRVARAWAAEGTKVSDILETAKGLRRADSTYRADRVAAAVSALQTYLEGGAEGMCLPQGFELFTTDKLQSSLKKGQAAPEHPFFALCQALSEASARLVRLTRIAVLGEALRYLREELAGRKARRRVLSFDDLLRDLARALEGPGGDSLAQRIRAQFPVAMIDEFQDTDPLQYAIFRRVYRNAGDGGLFMIGDPKQAIYSFRGADIFTYIEARRDTDPATDHFTLDTNYRSSQSLVAGINRIFGRSPAPFVYEEDIVFHRVRAGGDAARADLSLDGQPGAPLVVWLLERTADNTWQGSIPKSRAQPLIARACAAEIARLLALGAAGRARVAQRSLEARDIAVLVRDRYEARAVQQALRAARVASVYLSRDSVLATLEAQELARLLAAIAEPGNERALRAALCGELLGGGASELDGLAGDDLAWERRLQQFHGYHELWQSHGFMAMFQRLLHEQGVIARVLAAADGERRLTNLLQLGELLQAASEQQAGGEALLRWLAEHRAAPDGESEEQQLRLESDEDLVKIVTIHRSKGLEYPVVLLPFVWGSRPVAANRPFTFHDEAQRRLHGELGSDEMEAHHRLAERERLAEDLRLLYVAMTRAKLRCYLTWGQLNGAGDSALAYLLHPPGEDERARGAVSGLAALDDAQIRGALDALAAQDEGLLQVLSLPDAHEPLPAAGSQELPSLAARVFRGTVDAGWRVTSYSALADGYPGRVELPDYDALERVPAPGAEAPPSAATGMFGFPRGSRAGTFLHGLLERLDFPAAHGSALQAEVARHLQRFGFESHWQATVEDLVGNVLDTRLDAAGDLRLRDLPRHRRRVEVEFYYPLHPAPRRGVPAAVADILDYTADGEGLSFSFPQGMMKGYIDLVLEHAGRFYLADYKSNHLGDSLDDYRSVRLREAMRAHRYDLQYLIYGVALHRYLRRRKADYDYARHFGGVYYLFLRGMAVDRGPDCGVFFDRPEPQMIAELDAYFAGE